MPATTTISTTNFRATKQGDTWSVYYGSSLVSQTRGTAADVREKLRRMEHDLENRREVVR